MTKNATKWSTSSADAIIIDIQAAEADILKSTHDLPEQFVYLMNKEDAALARSIFPGIIVATSYQEYEQLIKKEKSMESLIEELQKNLEASEIFCDKATSMEMQIMCDTIEARINKATCETVKTLMKEIKK